MLKLNMGHRRIVDHQGAICLNDGMSVLLRSNSGMVWSDVSVAPKKDLETFVTADPHCLLVEKDLASLEDTVLHGEQGGQSSFDDYDP